jgi:hypothetical protein
MLKRLALATALASSVTLAAGVSPAAAGSPCPAGRACLYFNSSLEGARFDLDRADGRLNDELFNDGPAGANGWQVQVEDNAASFTNRSGRWAFLYRDRNCQLAGDVAAVQPGASVNLGAGDINLKNKVSSFALGDNPFAPPSSCANVDSSPF